MNRSAVELERRRAEAAARKSIHRRPRRRFSPFAFILFALIAGAGGYLAYSLTQNIETMTTALAVVGAVGVLVTLWGIGATVRAGRDGAGGHALLYALIGGGAAMVASLSFATALILASLQT